MLEISWSEPAGYVSITPASVNGPNKDLIRPRQRRGDYNKEGRLCSNERGRLTSVANAGRTLSSHEDRRPNIGSHKIPKLVS